MRPYDLASVFGRTDLHPRFSLKRMSLMTSCVRPLLAALLCSVVVFGHAPAWWHVATCDHPVVADDSHATCSHGHHHDAGSSSSSELDGHVAISAAHHHGSHDHDACLICQSLISPSGSALSTIISLPVDRTAEPLSCCVDAVFTSASITIACPRGPPVVA